MGVKFSKHLAYLLCLTFPAWARQEAPRDGMLPGHWASGIKEAFGTAFEVYDSHLKYSAESATAPISKVWFTVAEGVLTETFWPTLDKAQVHDSQLLMVDEQGRLYEERRDFSHKVEWLKAGVPAYKITSQDALNKVQIEKVIFVDPDRNCLRIKVTVTQKVAGLKFYWLHNPAAKNSEMQDNALASHGGALPEGLYAWESNHAQALRFSVPLPQVSAAFSGPYDGYQDLQQHQKMTYAFDSATDGNVALSARLGLAEKVGTQDFELYLAFGNTPAEASGVIDQSQGLSFDDGLEKYLSQWQAYQSSLVDLSSAAYDQGVLFRDSVAVLKSMEDKTYEGAFVASPSVPWGPLQNETVLSPLKAKETGGYHLVWPRDLYQMATTMMAIGDYNSALASLNRLKAAQFGPNSGEFNWGGVRKISREGAFPQNFWVNGEANWTGLQMDEVAMPVILTYRLWKAQKVKLADYWIMISKAADFIQSFGPWSAQERWEENFGASPSTIASEITALWAAAELAHDMGDETRARLYRQTGDAWATKPGDNIDTWTFTQSGPQGNGKYYIRLEGAGAVDQRWDPNDSGLYYLANSGGLKLEKEVTDAGFLELVRFGVKAALDSNILESLPEIDSTIRVDVPGKGPGFRRYLFDRYNYNEKTGQQTSGMLWPLLSGERGHFELQKSLEANLMPQQSESAVRPYVQAIESFATPSHMIPEQVWDYGPEAGLPTGSATPLGWSHAEYIKLLRSKLDSALFDRADLAHLRAP